jgi:hypothetical protein
MLMLETEFIQGVFLEGSGSSVNFLEEHFSQTGNHNPPELIKFWTVQKYELKTYQVS